MSSIRRYSSVADGYWSLVIVQEGCWDWSGYKQPEGYGTFPHAKTWYAHRVSWELHNGPIPDGMHVLHTCDNPPCSNPAHLFLGTVADNMADRKAKGRNRGDPNAPRTAQRPSVRLYSEREGVGFREYRPNG